MSELTSKQVEAMRTGAREHKRRIDDARTATDMICESHPWLSWPHGECGGPGCPPSAGVGIMRQKVRELQIAVQAREAMIVELYYGTPIDDTNGK